MADGWARVTGKPGACAVTCGPGLAQLATSLIVASRARTPIVVFTAEKAEDDVLSPQRLDQRRFAEATECGYVRVTRPDYAHEAVRRAFTLAKIESRPIILSAPLDVQTMECEEFGPYENSDSVLPSPQRLQPDAGVLAEAARLIRSSRKPVIIAGRGAVTAGAQDAVVRLGERIGALVATSLLARTWLADTPYHAGIAGLFAPHATTELYGEADCVIGIGASLSEHTLESGYLFPNAKFVQIDSAPHVVMGTGRAADCYVRGDALAAVEALDALLAQHDFKQTGYRTPETRKKLDEPVDAAVIDIEPGLLDPRDVAAFLDEHLPSEIGMVSGNGHFFTFPGMHMKRPRSPAITALQFSAIGQGLGTAMGAAIATQRPLFLIEGDASLMMHIQELDTAARYDIPLLIVVFNDQALGSEYQQLLAHHLNPEPSVIQTPDLAGIARQWDVAGVRRRRSTNFTPRSRSSRKAGADAGRRARLPQSDQRCFPPAAFRRACLSCFPPSPFLKKDGFMRRRLPRKYLLGMLGALGAPLGAGAAETYTMRLSLPVAATAMLGIASLHFAAAVERRSNGQLKVEVYPNGQLGKEQESVDGLISGVVDFVANSSTFLESLFPRLQVFDLPFLFRNLASAHRVLDGPICAQLFSEMEPKGIVGLGWGDNGFKELESTRAIVTPDDMKGLRVRIQGSALFAASYQALGAVPVTVDVAEIMPSLNQHTIDGLDVAIDNYVAHKWYTAAKFVAMTNHLLSINLLIGSKRKIDSLPQPLQRIIREEGKATIPFWRSLLAPKLAEQIQFLKQNGVTFTEIQYPAFRKAVDPVYAQLQAKLGGDLIDRVIRAANA